MWIFDLIKKIIADKQAKNQRRSELLALLTSVDLLSEENIKLLQNKQDEFKNDLLIQEQIITSFKSAVNFAIDDGIVTEEEMNSLNQLKNILNIPINIIEEAKEKILKTNRLYEIANGQLPIKTVPNLLLQKGEVSHWSETGNIIEEKVVSKHYEGGSRGVSMRIAKGVTYRVGASRGKLVSETAILPVSTGNFVITNKRIVFQGDKKSMNLKFEKILDIHMYSDGIRVTNDKGKPTIIQFDSSNNIEIISAVLSGVVNIPE